MGLPLALSLLTIMSASPRLPQQQAVPTAERMPSPMRHAGTYHYATGTWTRQAGITASFGPDVIYNSTAPSGYFTTIGTVGTGTEGAMIIDAGGVPGPGNGHPFLSPPTGSHNAVSSFEFGYCDFSVTGGSSFEVSFMSSYVPCSGPPASPDATYQLTGLPVGGCWTVDIDLSGGSEWCLLADGGAAAPGWDNDRDLDSFGWSATYTGSSTDLVGFPIVGDPANTDPSYVVAPSVAPALDATGTKFGPVSLCQPGGSGYLNHDFFWLEAPPGQSYSGCRFWGSYRNALTCGSGTQTPFAAFHMLLRSSFTCDVFQSPCSSGGGGGLTTTYCAGVANSTGMSATLCASGSRAVVDNDVRLTCVDLPVGSFGFFLTSQSQGFVANPATSQGNLCLGGSIGRFVGPGQIKMVLTDGTVSLDTNLGEWSLGALPAPASTYPATAGSTSNFQLWYRDAVGGAATSNFTSAMTIFWI